MIALVSPDQLHEDQKDDPHEDEIPSSQPNPQDTVSSPHGEPMMSSGRDRDLVVPECAAITPDGF
jgi:hypothetical protein